MRLLTVAEAARSVGKDPSALAYRIKIGDLTVVSDGDQRPGRRRYVREEEVRALVWQDRSNGVAPRVRVRVRVRANPARLPLVPRDAARRVLAPPPLVGACHGSDTDLFFREDQESIAEAKAICRGCEVLDACRTWFLGREEFGIGGGMSASDRAKWRRENGVHMTGQVVVRL